MKNARHTAIVTGASSGIGFGVAQAYVNRGWNEIGGTELPDGIVIGTLDLLNALFQGLRHNSIGQFGATYFIPTVVVPALLVSHCLVFSLLLRRRRPAMATF